MRVLLRPYGQNSIRQPGWVYLTVAALALGSGLITAWNIGYAGYSTFYSTAARSMTISWRAAAYGAFDPRASITLDKLAGFLLPQAISARLFGFHAWSIALPQVIEGMVTVVASYLIGFRWRGIAAGLLAAAATAATPLLTSMFGHVMEDGLLTMSLALAFVCLQSALVSGRLLPLVGSGVWVAVGFQAKMLQAWLILPALALGYLVGAPSPWWQRLRRGTLAGVLAIVLSLAWMTAIQLVPAGQRPYIDGTTDNNIYAMVFGYNGINRLVPDLVPGVVGDGARERAKPPPLPVFSTAPAGPRGRHVPAGARPAHRSSTPVGTQPGDRRAKLVLPYYTTQIGWLYPLALAGLALELWPFLRRRRRRMPLRTSATGYALGLWLVTVAGLLTLAKVPHTAYLAAVSVQLAVLAGAGLVRAFRLYRLPRPLARLVLPGLVATETAWTAVVLWTSAAPPAFLLPTVLIIGMATVLFLVLPARNRGRPRSASPRRTAVALAAAVAAVLLAPVVWTGLAIDPARDGTASDAYVGARPHAAAGAFRVGVPLRAPSDPVLSAGQWQLVRFLRAHTHRGEPLMATDQWPTASPFILDGGLDVQAMGGYSGLAPTPTLPQLQQTLAGGRLRYVLVTTFTPRTGRNFDLLGIRYWVSTHCTFVPPAEYGGPVHSLLGQRLYDCQQATAPTRPKLSRWRTGS